MSGTNGSPRKVATDSLRCRAPLSLVGLYFVEPTYPDTDEEYARPIAGRINSLVGDRHYLAEIVAAPPVPDHLEVVEIEDMSDWLFFDDKENWVRALADPAFLAKIQSVWPVRPASDEDGES